MQTELEGPKSEIRAEFLKTRQEFTTLLKEIGETEWFIPGGNPDWTLGEVLNHVVMVMEMTPLDIRVIRSGMAYPSFPVALFDRFNLAAARMRARRCTRAQLADRFEQAHAGLLELLESIRAEEWALGANFPDVDPPLLSGFVTIADIFRYSRQHFVSHAGDIRQGLERIRQADAWRRTGQVSPEAFEPQLDGLMAYPAGGLRKQMFKAPIYLYRLGLGRLVGWIMLLVTHTGRKSGLPRRTMLEFHDLNGSKYVPSAFGSKSQWYRNIENDPRVTIQTAQGAEAVVASRVQDDAEILAVYNHFMRRDPPLTRWYLQSRGVDPSDPLDVLKKKDRLYFVRFDATEEPTPPPLKADLLWVWPLLLLGAAVFWIAARRKGK